MIISSPEERKLKKSRYFTNGEIASVSRNKLSRIGNIDYIHLSDSLQVASFFFILIQYKPTLY